MNFQRRQNGQERVVVTGLGVVSPLGLDADSTWEALVQGRTGVGPITAFDASQLPVRIAAGVKGFDPSRHMDPREARRLSPFIHYAIAAANEAISNADLDFSKEDPMRAGVEIGSALGGINVIEEQRLVLESKGARHINPTMIPAVLINSPACSVAIRYRIKGPVSVPVAACATGVVAVGEAARRLAQGEADVMIAGGTDSVTTPLAIAAFSRLGALSPKNDDPEHACAPFDAHREGTVVGEGAAIVVLETLAHAVRRDAPVLAELLGYGLTSDAYHLVAPEPNGEGAARAMVQALAWAGVWPAELDWISAHGTGTQLNDASETLAVKAALGEQAYKVPISSIKGAVGHMLGAAGAISIVAAVRAMYAGLIPPTLNYRTPDPECDLDYVPNTARAATMNTVIVNGFGFGGQNACLVLRKQVAASR